MWALESLRALAWEPRLRPRSPDSIGGKPAGTLVGAIPSIRIWVRRKGFFKFMKTSKKLTIMGLSAATALVAATGAVSSFAWFAVNGSVTATGMSIKTKVTDNYLEIKNGASDDTEENWKTTVATVETTVKEVAPTHVFSAFDSSTKTGTAYAGGTALNWVKATSDDASKADKKGDYELLTNIAGYVLQDYYTIRIRPNTGSETLTAKNLKFSDVAWADSSKITGDAVSMAKTMRVLAVNETSSKGTMWSYTGGSWAIDSTTSAVLADNFTDKAPQTIRVYVFFDGEDTACTSKNASVALTTGYSVNLTFSIDA